MSRDPKTVSKKIVSIITSLGKMTGSLPECGRLYTFC